MLLRSALVRRHFSQVSSALMKQLRDESGSPIQQCKIALEASGGDIEKAKQWLKEKGLAQAQKKLQKETREGVIGVQLAPDNRSAIIAEINCETDFVARNTLFQSFVKGFLTSAAQSQYFASDASASAPSSTQEQIDAFLQKQNFGASILDGQSAGTPIDEVRRLVISKLQENISVRRVQRIAASSENEVIGYYAHNEIEAGIGNSGCVAVVNTTRARGANSDTLAALRKNTNAIAMQILGHKPQYYSREDVPRDIMAAEIETVKKELGKAYEGKPSDVQARMLEGKLRRFLDDAVLFEMEFILQEGQLVKDFF